MRAEEYRKLMEIARKHYGGYNRYALLLTQFYKLIKTLVEQGKEEMIEEVKARYLLMGLKEEALDEIIEWVTKK